LSQFLLYPSYNYTNKIKYLNYFKEEYWDFVKANAFPKKENDKFEIKYFVEVKKIISKSQRQIKNLDKYHIWANNHVNSYLKGYKQQKKAYIWIVRVYKLKKAYMAEINPAVRYVNLKDRVSLEGIEPVLNDSEFQKITEKIV
jgi:restriction system protein